MSRKPEKAVRKRRKKDLNKKIITIKMPASDWKAALTLVDELHLDDPVYNKLFSKLIDGLSKAGFTDYSGDKEKGKNET